MDDGLASLQAPQPPRIIRSLRAGDLAAAVGLAPADVIGDARIASAGTPFAFLQALLPDQVDALVPDHAAIAKLMPSPAGGLTVFARHRDGSCNVRMFAPQDGVFEDPATGSSAAAMAALLLADDPASDGQQVLIRQGVAMGRPSEILLTPLVHDDGTAGALVSGHAVIIGEGRLYL